MKFLIDENVCYSVSKYLINKGHNVIIATKLENKEDCFLLEYAFKENRIIITNDKDFGFFIYRQILPSRGVILFRFVQELPSLKIAALEVILSRDQAQILDHFIVASEGKIRVRPLKR